MLSSDVSSILDNKDRLLTQTYFDLQRYFEDKYGNDTVVFMEIGTFFEVYEVNNDEQQIFNFIWKNKEPGQVYMIPTDMENFRLETGAAAFVDFKSVPTKDVDVIDWLTRFFQVQNFTRRKDGVDVCYQLERLSIEFGVTHIIQTKFIPEVDCPNAVEKYQDDRYLMYEILIQQ